MLKRLRDLGNESDLSQIQDANVYGLNDEKLGTVDDVVYDPDISNVGYAVIDSGGWLKSRKFLVPADHLSAYHDRDDTFYVPISKDSVSRLPEFKDDLLDDDARFRQFETNYRTHWTSIATPTQTHPRLSTIGRTREVSATPIRETTVRDTAPRSSGTPVSIYGVYNDEEKAHEAVDAIKAEGFRESDISVVFPDKEKSKRFAIEANTKAPEGAATGGVTGVIAGGVLGWLAGVGTLAIPGIGPLLAAGPIVAALAGAGAGGAIGGLAGGLIGMGLPELEAKRYEAEVKKGGILVSVNCDDARFLHSARRALERTGARDLFVTGETKAA